MKRNDRGAVADPLSLHELRRIRLAEFERKSRKERRHLRVKGPR